MNEFKLWVEENQKTTTVKGWFASRQTLLADVLQGINSGLSRGLAFEYLRTKHNFPFKRKDSLYTYLKEVGA